jgi:hypothetical protein
VLIAQRAKLVPVEDAIDVDLGELRVRDRTMASPVGRPGGSAISVTPRSSERLDGLLR